MVYFDQFDGLGNDAVERIVQLEKQYDSTSIYGSFYIWFDKP